jgi:uncharacterized tellurite resistance protein B-like protein
MTLFAKDDILLFHAMMLTAGADGRIDKKELATVESFLATIPGFQDKDFGSLVDAANQVIHRYGGMEESVKSLAEIESASKRVKCYVLATDVALSSGDLAAAEVRMLEAMREVLDIETELARRIHEVLALKYTQ